jgi:hypothetical protein
MIIAATSPMLAEIGGIYLKDNDIAPLNTRRGASSLAQSR